MKLSDQDIREFIEAWREDFGETIAPDEARYRATQLLELAFMLASTPPEKRNPAEG